jgi:thiol-disulfide isomerase/thioredoxin
MSTNVTQQRARHEGIAAADLPVEGMLPSFDGATTWLNSPPLTPGGLRGKAVLVQFWTYTCINWRRTHPYVRAWARHYRDGGLVVIGVHTPEFAFEHDLDNVKREAVAMGIDWPVVVDNDYGVWRAFANHYWPALYFVDAGGRIRHHRFGEGDYERSEMVIRQLLADAGTGAIPDQMADVVATGPEVDADWSDLRSPETYTGTDQAENFDGFDSARLRLNHWSLSGDWTVRSDAIALNRPDGRIAFQFHARDLHLVMGPAAPGSRVRFRVLLDGEPAAAAHGADVDDKGNGTVGEQRMYQLIRQPKPIGDRRFEIEFLDAGAEAFCFTFG